MRELASVLKRNLLLTITKRRTTCIELFNVRVRRTVREDGRPNRRYRPCNVGIAPKHDKAAVRCSCNCRIATIRLRTLPGLKRLSGESRKPVSVRGTRYLQLVRYLLRRALKHNDRCAERIRRRIKHLDI